MLRGFDIEKRFGETVVLTGASVDIEAGSVTALIGPSGAGKSTLLRALSLVDPPTRGVVEIDDAVYRFPDNNGRFQPKPWPDVTVVFQQLFLWPHLSLRRNIFLPVEKHNGGKGRHFALGLVRSLGLEECIDRLPYEVSIGQRQRAAIVRGLALKPKYLFLDEVTSALDVEQVRKLGECIIQAKSEGCAFIVVTHLLGFAKAVADRVVFIDGGKLLESGPIELLDHPAHKRIQEFVALA